jgi:GR25 family glycosyltransferase involved in LPS biosynthesis
MLKKLLKEPSDINYYLILEDDVELVKPIEELCKLLENIPEDTDMCHLAKSDWFPFKKTTSVNNYFSECKKEYFNRTTAYIISKRGGQKILDYAKDHIDIPADDLLSNMYNTDMLRVYVPAKYIFHESENTISIIRNFVGK